MNSICLSKERLEEIEALLFDSEWTRLHPVLRSAITDLLADEQFWREAVKKARYMWECPFCRGIQPVDLSALTIRSNVPAMAKPEAIPHKPDCPWFLAQ